VTVEDVREATPGMGDCGPGSNSVAGRENAWIGQIPPRTRRPLSDRECTFKELPVIHQEWRQPHVHRALRSELIQPV
jgi:hypothetical protein